MERTEALAHFCRPRHVVQEIRELDDEKRVLTAGEFPVQEGRTEDQDGVRSIWSRPGKIKVKYGCYIELFVFSDWLQILSAEDDESPIMSFSSGTLIGEVYCLMCLNSKVNVRSASYCELQTLSINNLYNIVLSHPEIKCHIVQKLSTRINTAKFEKEFHEMNSSMVKSDGIQYSLDKEFRKVKCNWRDVCNVEKYDTNTFNKAHDANFYSANLDLLALSDKTDLQVNSICLRNRCPFIIDPVRGFYKFCNFMVLVSVMCQGIVIPKALFFSRTLTYSDLTFCFIMDIFYFLDIYLQVSSVVKTKHTLLTNFTQILILRVKEVPFLIDFIASFPLDYIAYAMYADMYVVAICKLFKLLKMYKVYTSINAYQDKISANTIMVAICKYTLMYFYTVYWLTCLMYGVSCGYDGCEPHSWFNYNMDIFGYNKTFSKTHA